MDNLVLFDQHIAQNSLTRIVNLADSARLLPAPLG